MANVMEKKEKILGYVRVSSKDQNEDRQLIAMKQFGVAEENIFIDKQSGKDFNRPAYKKLIQKLRKGGGDLVVIKSIDRLGRDYDEIIEQWRIITKEIKADIVVLDMELLDTRREKNFLGTFISDIVLQILSFVAQNERENIKQRQAEGILAAKEKGIRLGRPKLRRPANYEDVQRRWHKGEIGTREAGKLLNVSHQTFLNWVKSDD